MSSTTTPASSTGRAPHLRARIGWLLGLVVPLAIFWALPDDLATEARLAAAVGGLLAVWWVTEPIPIPVTSLLPIVLFPVLGVADVAATTAPYANSVVFLVLGGVLLGLATQRWNLHRRIALLTVLAVGTRPSQVVFGLMLASAFISAWVSNTATAVIMVPIATSVLGLFTRGEKASASQVKLGLAMLLGVAYGVTIGSMATLIGQPPMALMRGYLAETHDITIGFAQWMLVGVPFAAVLLVVAWLVLTKLVFRADSEEIPGGRTLIRSELDSLGALSAEERRVMAVFGGAVFFWVAMPLLAAIPAVAAGAPWLSRIDDTSVAVLAACLMFVIPAKREPGALLSWSATSDVPWGVLLLFGGGLSLSAQFTQTGLSAWIGESVGGLAGVSPLLLMLVIVLVCMGLTELTSNTAMAAAFLPIMGAIGVGVGIDPLLMSIAVTLAVGSAFMLPVATPSNAVAFATGEVPITAMVRAGVWLNVVGIVLVMSVVLTLVPWVFGVSL